jgi:2-oxoisovalerate dehydrogenase E1 component
MLFIIEDNRYSLSVPADRQTPGGNIAANLASFQNLRVIDSDGTNPATAWLAISADIEHIRAGEAA